MVVGMMHSCFLSYESGICRSAGLPKSMSEVVEKIPTEFRDPYPYFRGMIADLIGFVSAFFSFLAGMFYLVYKLVFWQSFTVGVARLVLGLFFLGFGVTHRTRHHWIDSYPRVEASPGYRERTHQFLEIQTPRETEFRHFVLAVRPVHLGGRI